MEIVKIINSNKCNNSYGNSPLDSMQPLGNKKLKNLFLKK